MLMSLYSMRCESFNDFCDRWLKICRNYAHCAWLLKHYCFDCCCKYFCVFFFFAIFFVTSPVRRLLSEHYNRRVTTWLCCLLEPFRDCIHSNGQYAIEIMTEFAFDNSKCSVTIRNINSNFRVLKSSFRLACDLKLTVKGLNTDFLVLNARFVCRSTFFLH